MLHPVAQLFTACGDEANNGNDSLPGEGVKYQTLLDLLKNARDKDEESRRKEGLVSSANQLFSSRPEDHIVNDLRELPCKKIEVSKKKNHPDILAYIEDSLKSMPRFRQLNAGPRIARKSDGMIKCKPSPIASSSPLTHHSVDANMVIENLKQSKAATLEVALVADDIERCYEDLGTDEDDDKIEEKEKSDNSSAVIGVSTGMEPQEEDIDYKDRESVKRLKTVCRDFLKFSSAVVDIQHRSVRDFISSEEKSLAQDPRICPDCAERMNQVSTYQASPKHGHLIVAKNFFRKLMSRSFQDNSLTSESVALQHGPDIGIENLAPKGTVSLGTETTELATHIAAEAEKDNPTSDLPDFDSDEEEPPRYELAQWPRHLRAAEEAWPPAERDTDLQERWEKLYTIIEIILSPGSRVYRDWSRRLSLWRSQPFGPASRCS
ncbi:hypothetical protein HO173_005572 [Letharia columbiana]|uniref:Uncharacterized protein n=1 Tax=Letharia columbiana TaxID=112416 RepID=A0A8H6L5J0_9LECA|nr:uncharacterized protein HO173_005572 [Letharia columbiana]KAF6236319.1 hypothetical protein HO173_005572 [Letharia columbiana]